MHRSFGIPSSGPNTKGFHDIENQKSVFRYEKIKQELDKCDLLCSNCHKETHFTPIILGTLLDTVKPKEKPCRAPQLCCDCNVAITRHSLRCKKCHGRSTRKVARPKRDLLLEMIEKTSYVQVGRKFGVSDNTIRKWILSPQKD